MGIYSANLVHTKHTNLIKLFIPRLCRNILVWAINRLKNQGMVDCAADKQDINILRPGQNCRHYADVIFKWLFLNENVWMLLKISLKFVPKFRISNTLKLVQIMAWPRPGNTPLSGLMRASFLTHMCVTQPQWVNRQNTNTYVYLLRNIVIIYIVDEDAFITFSIKISIYTERN